MLADDKLGNVYIEPERLIYLINTSRMADNKSDNQHEPSGKGQNHLPKKSTSPKKQGDLDNTKSTKPKDNKRYTKQNNNNNRQHKTFNVDLTEKKFVDTNIPNIQNNDICFICTEHMRYRAVGECDHSVCLNCNLRLRALYNNRACTLCKVDQPTVVYTSDMKMKFNDFNLKDIPRFDVKLNIYFSSYEIEKRALSMLLFNCPVASCDTVCNQGWREMKSHVQSKHGRYLCDLCIKFKKIFVHEQQLYTQNELNHHKKKGDSDDQSFKGHPFCIFCKTYFFDDEKLFEHCRDAHEKCFLCDDQFQYYKDFKALEVHMKDSHIRCSHPFCEDDRFAYFKNEEDFQVHNISKHGNSKTRGKSAEIMAYGFYNNRTSNSGNSTSGKATKSVGKRGLKSIEHLQKLPSELFDNIKELLNNSESAIFEMDEALSYFLDSSIKSDEFISMYMNIVKKNYNDVNLPNKTTELSKSTIPSYKEKEVLAGKIWRELAIVIPENDLKKTYKDKKNAVPRMDLYNVTYQDMLRAWSDWKSDQNGNISGPSISELASATNDLSISGSSSSINKPSWVSKNSEMMSNKKDIYFPTLETVSKASSNTSYASNSSAYSKVATSGAALSATRKSGIGGKTVVGISLARNTSAPIKYTVPNSLHVESKPSNMTVRHNYAKTTEDFPDLAAPKISLGKKLRMEQLEKRRIILQNSQNNNSTPQNDASMSGSSAVEDLSDYVEVKNDELNDDTNDSNSSGRKKKQKKQKQVIQLY